ASHARKPVYRQALEAYRLLQGVESGKRNSIRDVISGTIIGPMEPWRRFELAVGLAAADAVSHVLGQPVTLRAITGTSSQPFASVGRIDIYWQTQTALFRHALLAKWEELAERALLCYGLA